MRDKPELFDLARLLDAGLAPAAAVARLRADRPRETPALERLATELQRGRSLAAALKTAGYANELEAAVVRVGEQAGKLEPALQYLAQSEERRRIRIAGLRVRLWLPNLVFGIVLVIGIVRALTAGATWVSALTEAGVSAIVVLGLSAAIVAGMSRGPSLWLGLAWRFGLIKPITLLRRYFEHRFFTLLKWQADAGLDFVSGAKTLASLIDDPGFRRDVGRYGASLQRGDGVTQSLERCRLVRRGELTEVLRVGEHSGRLGEALERFLSDEGARLERVTDRMFTWLPRTYYIVLLLLGAASLT